MNHKNEAFLKSNVWSGFLFGIGLVAFIDEAVFHQVLHWHHFYDKLTTNIGLVSDGIFHAFSWFATIAGLFLYSNLRRQRSLHMVRWVGGIFLGGGLFQLYDGTVQHKLMRLHQIRYVDNVLFYDMVWNILAIGLVVIGVLLSFRKRNRDAREGIANGGH
jgi:uncharacterized membrane protein